MLAWGSHAVYLAPIPEEEHAVQFFASIEKNYNDDGRLNEAIESYMENRVSGRVFLEESRAGWLEKLAFLLVGVFSCLLAFRYPKFGSALMLVCSSVYLLVWATEFGVWQQGLFNSYGEGWYIATQFSKKALFFHKDVLLPWLVVLALGVVVLDWASPRNVGALS